MKPPEENKFNRAYLQNGSELAQFDKLHTPCHATLVPKISQFGDTGLLLLLLLFCDLTWNDPMNNVCWHIKLQAT